MFCILPTEKGLSRCYYESDRDDYAQACKTEVYCDGTLPTNRELFAGLRDLSPDNVIGPQATFKDLPGIYADAHRWEHMSFGRVTLCDQGMIILSMVDRETEKLFIRVANYDYGSARYMRTWSPLGKGADVSAHILIREAFHGDTVQGWRKEEVVTDHINGLGGDNRWCNLRPVCFQINNWNRHTSR